MGIVASFISLFGLTGCREKEAKFKPTEGAEIMSLSIFESQMDLNHCYSFGLREEDDGTVYFFAQYQQHEDGVRIDLEDYEVDKAYMDELRKIAAENGVVDYVKAYKKRKMKVFALDAPSYSTSISMSDGSSRTIESRCDGSAELRSFFIEIAEKCGGTDSSETTVSE